MFKYLILFWGLLECCLGVIISLKKDVLILKNVFGKIVLFTKDFNINDIEDKSTFSTWIGDMILVEGAVYTFLGATSLYFQMNNLIIVFFIIIIEVIFFNILIKGFKNFNN